MMSQHVPPDKNRKAGDREYFWFALLLIVVLATSASPSYPARDESAAAKPRIASTFGYAFLSNASCS